MENQTREIGIILSVSMDTIRRVYSNGYWNKPNKKKLSRKIQNAR